MDRRFFVLGTAAIVCTPAVPLLAQAANGIRFRFTSARGAAQVEVVTLQPGSFRATVARGNRRRSYTLTSDAGALAQVAQGLMTGPGQITLGRTLVSIRLEGEGRALRALMRADEEEFEGTVSAVGAGAVAAGAVAGIVAVSIAALIAMAAVTVTTVAAVTEARANVKVEANSNGASADVSVNEGGGEEGGGAEGGGAEGGSGD